MKDSSKLVVAICVHNRYENIKTWLRCWKECNQHGAELVIIHNYYGDEVLKDKFQTLCHDVTYIPRNGQGFDIGAFQDVCKGRLAGFPEWDTLLWCCDDTFPMAKDFLTPFFSKLTPGVGVVCMDLSPYVRQHIRTTGFLIGKETAQKLTFEVDPVTTKEECYRFEHRDPQNWFYRQVVDMGLWVVQADTREKCTLWDSGYHRKLPRGQEHANVFPKNSKVTFIAPIFDAFPEIISSLMCQTYQNWELLLIDDNPADTVTGRVVEAVNDKRIKYIRHERVANFGHPLRRWALTEIGEGRLSDPDYIVITNGDNFHTPNYIESMLSGFINSPDALAVYCSDMVHSYIKWNIIPCQVKLGYIDCAGVMVRRDVACEIGWRDIESHSSDFTYFSDIIQKYGAASFVKVKGCLLSHN